MTVIAHSSEEGTTAAAAATTAAAETTAGAAATAAARLRNLQAMLEYKHTALKRLSSSSSEEGAEEAQRNLVQQDEAIYPASCYTVAKNEVGRTCGQFVGMCMTVELDGTGSLEAGDELELAIQVHPEADIPRNEMLTVYDFCRAPLGDVDDDTTVFQVMGRTLQLVLLSTNYLLSISIHVVSPYNSHRAGIARHTS